MMSCSEGDSKPALGEGPKVFMLAEAISDIRKSLPCAIFLARCYQHLTRTISFITIILVIILV